MIDLHTYSCYCDHINATASDEDIKAFHAKSFDDQLAISSAWADSADIQKDKQLAEDNA